MTQKMIIAHLKYSIQNNAFCAYIYEQLKHMGFDSSMMEYLEHTCYGKAFQAIQTLALITDKPDIGDDLFDKATEEARDLVRQAEGDIVTMLNAAGHDGEAYYKNVTDRNW